MPILSYVESKIKEVEGFPVVFRQNGKDIHGTKENIPSYPYSSAAQDSWTVQEWKSKRFQQIYPGYDVDVRTQNGGIAAGNMKLSTVRGK